MAVTDTAVPTPPARKLHRVKAVVNGEPREADVWPGASLLFALRDNFGLPGSKNACEEGECGARAVFLDGKIVCSCARVSSWRRTPRTQTS
jgi:aerobic-type carbon monoxide dehydrogenase small subunit (CoxS/CutS family)